MLPIFVCCLSCVATPSATSYVGHEAHTTLLLNYYYIAVTLCAKSVHLNLGFEAFGSKDFLRSLYRRFNRTIYIET